MNLGTSSPVNVDLTTSNIFVECWIYLNSGISYPNIMSVGPSSGIWNWKLTFFGTTLNPRLGMKYNGNNLNSSVAIAGFQTWSHVAFSFNSTSAGAGTAYIFANGQLGGSMALTGLSYFSSEIPLIGRNFYNVSEFLNGYIQDLRVVKGGTVPTTSFTPVLPPFSSPLPYSLTGTPVYTLLGQFITYKSGKIQNQAINFPNSSSTGTTVPTTYIEYTVSLNSTPGFTISLWVNFNVVGVFAQVVLMAGAKNILFLDNQNILYYSDAFNPGAIFPLPALTVGTWYNPVIVVSGTTATLYLNGNSTVATTVTIAETLLRVGGSGSNYSAWCSVQDLRIYNTPLSAIQVQALYANGGSPSVPASLTLYRAQGLSSSMTGTPLLSQLSVAPVAAFSLRAVNGLSPSGTAKAVQVRRASDNATQDFYADRLGNLLTAPVTGTDLATWLGGATGYVATWYNQLNPLNNASQPTAASQPTISGGAISFTGAQWFSNTATTGGLLANGQQKYSYAACFNSSNGGTSTVCDTNSASPVSNQDGRLIIISNSVGFNGEYNDQWFMTAFTNGVQKSVVMMIDNTQVNNITTVSAGVTVNKATASPGTLNLNNFWFGIGRKMSGTGSEYFSGTMKSVMVFDTALSAADAAILDTWQGTL
jgi:hypothetical protein